MSFVAKVKTSSGDLVYLVRGEDKQKEAWHYVLVDRLKCPLFLQAVECGSVDVAEYGQVLYSGWGKHPPQVIIDAIKAEYA